MIFWLTVKCVKPILVNTLPCNIHEKVKQNIDFYIFLALVLPKLRAASISNAAGPPTKV